MARFTAKAALSVALVFVSHPSFAAVTAGDVMQDKTGYHLSWTAAAPVDVLVSTDPAATPAVMRVLARGQKDGKMDAPSDVVAGRAYFLVKESAEPKGLRLAVRRLPLEGVVNFRDLGGYATSNGNHVKWGKVFRSSELSSLTPADDKVLDGLGLRLICDLRTSGERQSQPTHWLGAGTEMVTSDKSVIEGSSAFAGERPTPETVRKGMSEVYLKLYKIYEPEYKTMFARALAGQTPMLVHCSGGRDRTGIGSAWILSALGVPRATIFEDYELTGKYVTPEWVTSQLERTPPVASVASMSKLPPELRKAALKIERSDLESVFQAVERDYGSVERYLEQVYGLTPAKIAQLRAALTE